MSKTVLTVSTSPVAVRAGQATFSVGVQQVIGESAVAFKVYDAAQVQIGSVTPNGGYVWNANKKSGDPFLPGEIVGYIAVSSGTDHFLATDLSVVAIPFVSVSYGGTALAVTKGINVGDGLAAVLSDDGQSATLSANPVTALSADGAVAVSSGLKPITKAGVAVLTLAAPVAGTDDGKKLTFVDTTGNAHTITTPAAAINGADHIATFGGSIGDSIVLEAYDGVWYSKGTENGVTLS